MGGHPVSFVETLHRRLGNADIHLLAAQAVGNAVEVAIEIDVVVNVDAGLFPLGVLIGCFGQGLERGAVQFLEPACAAAGKFAEGTVVQQLKPLPDGGIGLGQGEEGAVPEPGQDETLDDLNAHLHLGLVLGAPDPGRNDGRAVMGCHLGIGGVDLGLVPAGPGHPALQVVGDNGPGDSTQKGKCPHMGPDPVGKRLAAGGLGIGEVAGTEHRYENRSLVDLSRGGIDDGKGLAAVVDKELLSRPVFLAHGEIEPLVPLAVEVAEVAVLVP